jgi:radical SAM superfamily enzyme YgiQ (UPF0313 family)
MATMRRKITFVHAPEDYYDQNYGTRFIPLWAYTLASYVPDGWDVEIVDCKIEDPAQTGAADVFGFSGINQDIDSIKKVYSLLKAKYPSATFILGGPITWSLEQEGKIDLLQYFDHIFILDGEKTLPDFLRGFESGEAMTLPQVIRAERYDLHTAKKISFDLFRRKVSSYYGGVVEVSRGCPFLCEFCDIRVLPGNNRSNNRDVGSIVEELDQYYKLGITQIQFACDNFIGDIAWARQCVDAIVEWKERVGAKVSIFTWLTINLYKMPYLMTQMRRAGFSVLFIGIESVNRNSLLETAKVQNIKLLNDAVIEIHSYGFVIAPGFIFGFDSDTKTIFEDTLKFFVDTGLIGGDPSFLTALPGTPLFERMQRTGRLVDRPDTVTVRKKIETNIRYLQDPGFLVRGFLDFVRIYTSPQFQYARFEAHMKLITESGKFIPTASGGYGSPIEYLKLQLANPYKGTMVTGGGSSSVWQNRRMLLLRIAYILRRPSVLLAVLKAWRLVSRCARRYPGLGIHFNYWLYVWTNIGLKYWGIKENDFQLHTVDKGFDFATLLGQTRSDDPAESGAVGRGDPRHADQARFTNQALEILVKSRASSAGD